MEFEDIDNSLKLVLHLDNELKQSEDKFKKITSLMLYCVEKIINQTFKPSYKELINRIIIYKKQLADLKINIDQLKSEIDQITGRTVIVN